MYDVVVIGGGPGGYAAAIRSAQLGGRVALIEAGEIGGTCVNRGCIPTKVWLRAAYLLYCWRRGEMFGFRGSIEKPDFSMIVARKSGVGQDIRVGMESLLANNGVELVRGRAMLKNAREVGVQGRDLPAEKIILATGSVLSKPRIPGLEQAALTTDELLDLDHLPHSVLIYGGGPIEVEAAQILGVFGSQVCLLTDQPRILAREDSETSQRIAQALRDQGIEIVTRTNLEEIRSSGAGFEAVLSGKSARTLLVDRVLVGSRTPNTADLGLESAGVRLNDDHGVRVNDRLETSLPGVFAIGDVTGGWMQSHAASAMAVTAAENALGQDNRFPFNLVPRGIWTFPQVGSVGLSEEEAEEAGYEVEVGSFPMSINGLAMSYDELTGAVKMVADSETGELLGVHMVGANATELVGEAVLALQLECTTDELAHTMRVHPTFSEAVMDAGRDAMAWALYLPKR